MISIPTNYPCQEARCLYRLHVEDAKILPLVGHARFKQDPIKP